MRKYSKRAQINRMRRLLSECVKLRDKKCVRCGKEDGKLDCSHIFPKGRFSSMQFELENVKLLCFNCHRNFWHLNPVLANDWVRKWMGSEKYENLKETANTQNVLINRGWLDSKETELKNALEGFRRENS